MTKMLAACVALLMTMLSMACSDDDGGSADSAIRAAMIESDLDYESRLADSFIAIGMSEVTAKCIAGEIDPEVVSRATSLEDPSSWIKYEESMSDALAKCDLDVTDFG